VRTWRYFSEGSDPVLFTCQETGEQGIDPDFVDLLDELRHRCGFAFVINSGYRSPHHSIEAKKDEPGEHTRGAADIRCAHSYQRYIIVREAIKMGIEGIGIDKDFVHVDGRKNKAGVIWTY